MSYNSQENKNKKSMFLKKKIDFSIPQNIMSAISNWTDCYNSNIMEKTKIQMHYDFENKINDTSLMTSSKKMSKSSKRSETDKIKYEKDIFEWLYSLSDSDLNLYSEKIAEYMNIDKNSVIRRVNTIRIDNKKEVFVDKSKISSKVLDNVEKEVKDVKDVKEVKNVKDEKEYKTDSNGKILYGDAWDLI